MNRDFILLLLCCCSAALFGFQAHRQLRAQGESPSHDDNHSHLRHLNRTIADHLSMIKEMQAKFMRWQMQMASYLLELVTHLTCLPESHRQFIRKFRKRLTTADNPQTRSTDRSREELRICSANRATPDRLRRSIALQPCHSEPIEAVVSESNLQDQLSPPHYESLSLANGGQSCAIGRRPYPVIEMFAPYQESKLPHEDDLQQMMCHGLDERGLSFFVNHVPNFTSVVVRLDHQGNSKDLTARVVSVERCSPQGKFWLVQCEFQGRVCL